MLPTDHFAGKGRIGRSWEIVVPPNASSKKKPLYSSLTELTFDDGGNGRPNTFSKYAIDGQFEWTTGGVERVGGKSAALSFGKFEDFTFEASAEYGREGGSFFLIGWNDGNGYIISDLQLRTTGTWYLTEIRNGVTIPEQAVLMSDKFRTIGKQNFRVSVTNGELSFQIGNNAIMRDSKLSNYREGSFVWGVFPSQYGPRPIKIFAARIRAS